MTTEVQRRMNPLDISPAPLVPSTILEKQLVFARRGSRIPMAFIHSDLSAHGNDTWSKLPTGHDEDIKDTLQASTVPTGDGLTISPLEAVRTGRLPFDCQPVVSTKDGHHYRLLISPFPILNNGQTIQVEVVDITQDRRAQLATNDFFARETHDLRIPLATIIGYGQLATRSLEDGGMNLGKYVGAITDAAKRMSGQISNTLRTARLVGENPYLVSEVVLVGNFLHAAILNNSKLQELIIVNDITLVAALPDETVKTKVFPREITSVIECVIGNAVRAIQDKGEQNGKVEISYEIVDKDLKVYFKDNGCGIAPERFKSIFQGDSTSGSGMGLKTGKKYLEVLGGDIYVLESAVGAGATFCVTLPLSG